MSGVRAVLVIRLLELFCSTSDESRGFTLLGDENQAIYDFAYRETQKGVTALEFLAQIRQTWRKKMVEREITHNYRCHPSVDTVITKSATILKRSRSTGADPIPELKRLMEELQPTGIGMALQNTNSSTAILCRNNGQALLQSFHLRDGLDADTARRLRVQTGGGPAKLPHWLGSFLGMYTAKAPIDKSTTVRIYKALSQQGVVLPYDANQLWMKLTEIMRSSSENSIPIDKLLERLQWPDSLPDDEYEDENGMVLLTTIHQSKGQEFDHVMVLREGLADDRHDNYDASEEGRVVYVAISRAKKQLSCIDDDSGVRLIRKTSNRRKHERWHGINVVNSGRSRKYINYLEIGIEGDLDEQSFVDPSLHCGDDNVKELQHFLANHAQVLSGKEVSLRKRTVIENDKRVAYYDIILCTSDSEKLLGTTTQQLALDLLKMRNHQKLILPRVVKGLRISQVYSHISSDSQRDHLAHPFAQSGIWLCVSIHGIGEYEYYFF